MQNRAKMCKNKVDCNLNLSDSGSIIHIAPLHVQIVATMQYALYTDSLSCCFVVRFGPVD